jgi:hypothetical protein
MKKLIMLALPVAMSIGVSSAALTNVACPTTDVSLTVVTTAGYVCEIGDKEFTNFVASGTTGTLGINFSVAAFNAITSTQTTTVAIEDTTSGTVQRSFNLAYNVIVDPNPTVVIAPGKTAAITQVGAGVQSSSNDVNATIDKTLSNGASGIAFEHVVNGQDSGSPGKQFVTGLSVTSLTASDVFVFTSGTSISAVQNSYQQTFTSTSSTPEPMSMLLFGGGLLAISLIGRKKLVRK